MYRFYILYSNKIEKSHYYCKPASRIGKIGTLMRSVEIKWVFFFFYNLILMYDYNIITFNNTKLKSFPVICIFIEFFRFSRTMDNN